MVLYLRRRGVRLRHTCLEANGSCWAVIAAYEAGYTLFDHADIIVPCGEDYFRPGVEGSFRHESKSYRFQVRHSPST